MESITPFTRKEKYINQIVGGGNTAPETPQTREELFYAAILGEVVAPSPITRSEKYLAKIANKYSGELPEPVTRIERFLARAAGMDVTIPTPVTREEMFWADYAFIVEKETSGIPPLAFNAVAGTLKNYRIYGNTVNGESVGDAVTDSQSVNYGKYRIPVTLTAGSAATTNIYLDTPLKKGRIYGFHIDPSVSDSSNAVTYIADAVGKTPAAMGANTFSYGDWENTFFMPKPCMLKSDGTVDYYLDPNDYTKKADGTPSDVANDNYDGNAMMEWGKIWYKFVPTETDGEVSFYVADYKADNDFECWCNIDSQNNETDHFYTAIYNGTGTEKLRSISGVALTPANGNGGTTVTQEVERATTNNTTNNVEWYTEVYSDRMLINMLLVLMGKSLNSQAVYGRGLDTGEQTAKEAYVTGTLNDKGLFWGDTSAGTSGIKVFGMENYWGCVWHRTAGLISIDNHAYAKLTYSTADGSNAAGYNQTGTDYLDFGSVPNTNDYVKTMKYNRKGLIPSTIGGTNVDSNHYYGDYYYQSNRTCYLLLGGNSVRSVGTGASCFYLSTAPTQANWNVSAALSCKPMSKGSKPHTADYIDYATQKRHNSDGTASTVTLPEITVTAGTNALSVGTAVQPSNVYIKYEGAR